MAIVESICAIPGVYDHDEVWMAVKRIINGSEVRYIELMNEDEEIIINGPEGVPVGAAVESICVIPGTYGHDEVWLSVKREINGNTVRYIELMHEDEKIVVAGYAFDCFVAGYEFAIDASSTPDTIVAGNAIDVYVTGGVGPFTFETASTGYTFTDPVGETNERRKVLNCVSGECGVAFDVIVYYTVTDACGSVLTGSARNTAGRWVSKEYLFPMQYHAESNAFYCLSCLLSDDDLGSSIYDAYDCETYSCDDVVGGYNNYYSEDKEWWYRQARATTITKLTAVCHNCANGYPSAATVWGAINPVNACSVSGSGRCTAYAIGGAGSGRNATPGYVVPDFSPLEWVYNAGDLEPSAACISKCGGSPWFYIPGYIQTYHFEC